MPFPRTAKQERAYAATLLYCHKNSTKHVLYIKRVRTDRIQFACRHCEYATSYRKTMIRTLLMNRMFVKKFHKSRKRKERETLSHLRSKR